jgi:hypothetical protein
MGLGPSLLFFGLPTLGAVFCFYVLIPTLIDAGILPFYAHSIALIIFFIVVPLFLYGS